MWDNTERVIDELLKVLVQWVLGPLFNSEQSCSPAVQPVEVPLGVALEEEHAAVVAEHLAFPIRWGKY